MSDIARLAEPDAGSPYRRRHARQTLTFLALVALVLVVGLVGYLVWTGALSIGGDGRPTAQPCPTPAQTAASAAAIRVNVLNATATRGLAGKVAKELQLRGFRVPQIANAPAGSDVASPAQLRYGPTGEFGARTVAAQINGDVELLVDDARTDDIVDVVIGPTYAGMRTVPDALALLTPAPAPSPSGCIEPGDDVTAAPLVRDPRPPATTPAATPTR